MATRLSWMPIIFASVRAPIPEISRVIARCDIRDRSARHVTTSQFWSYVGPGLCCSSFNALRLNSTVSPHATFTCMDCGVHKAAGWAATSPPSHAMSDLSADSPPPHQQIRPETRLCTRARPIRGLSALQALRRQDQMSRFWCADDLQPPPQ
jgi:hypothetical protein